MAEHRLSATVHDRLAQLLDPIDARLDRQYPGNRDEIQPVHTVYVSAAEVGAGTPRLWGEQAIRLLDAHAHVFAGLDTENALGDVRLLLGRNPVQDLRIDFEDGYGRREDQEEDAAARNAGRTLAAVGRGAAGPSWCGIRFKGLPASERRRSIRTLELVLDAAGGVPPGFVFTVPKLRAVEQVTATVLLCEELEKAHGLESGSLRFELQIESPQAVIAADGTIVVASAIHRAAGRLTGLHYGTYDYSASCGIAPQFQSLEHPVADHAKAVMLAAAAQTGVWVCDGSTQVAPVGTSDAIHDAVKRHHRLVMRSLERGYYQGWDMHPGHLVTRWLATFAFYRSALTAAAPRIQAYLDSQGGSVMDEPATAQALSAVVLRGLEAGAFTEADVLALAPAVDAAVLRNLVRRTTVNTGAN
ncbi:aldolase/citrate lyase family protein [Rhodococcus sp. IEGM 1379]|uniref:DUF6986 family protein n=1 Tax=Rhodococcus sp. IEGM 1379 TaxID=3047086 RepID=UPI0024B84093|nr:aldolase/citrate lyase family protein [Rhodococcus sp. IEGM 1379]MDI9914980.1 aldolase/citrate lyase family protein [Rhodococcus sp. IEGM 1379]